MSGSTTFPGVTGNASTARQHITLLPAVNQTVALARFFGSTVDPVFQVGALQPINAYVGRYPLYYNAVQDFYIPETTDQRTNYQLEPAMVSYDTTGSLTYALTYPDLLGYLAGQGAVTGQDMRMFETDYYVWGPPVDYDKLINFHQYYWFGDYTGGTDLPTLTLTAPTLAYVGDGNTLRFALPAPVGNISATYETVAAYVNSVKVSNGVIDATGISLPLAPDAGDQVVVTRYDDLTVPLTGAMVGAPIGNAVGLPDGNSVTTFALAGFVDPAQIVGGPAVGNAAAFALTSGMRVTLQDTSRIFNGWSTDQAGANGAMYQQVWDTSYLTNDRPGASTPHDRALFDGAQYSRFLVDGVGQSIRLTPDPWLYRELDPQHVTIDRSSVDQNPWSLSNNWVHQDAFAWSGQVFLDRQAKRPIIEFVRDLQLHDYGTAHAAPVDGVLSTATALALGPDLGVPLVGAVAIQADDIIGQTMGHVQVDGGVRLFPGMRLLVAQPTPIVSTASPSANTAISAVPNQRIYQVGQDVFGITLSPLPDSVPGAVVRVTHAWGSAAQHPANSEAWYDGTTWALAQPWREDATEANDPRFTLYDLNGDALDSPITYPNSDFAGSRIFGFAAGTGRSDRVLRRALQYDNNGAIVFEDDAVTRRANTVTNGVATPITGLYCYKTIGDDHPVSLWHPAATPTPQGIFTRGGDGTAYYTVPLNLAANPTSADVTFLSRSDWLFHFQAALSNQIGFAG